MQKKMLIFFKKHHQQMKESSVQIDQIVLIILFIWSHTVFFYAGSGKKNKQILSWIRVLFFCK